MLRPQRRPASNNVTSSKRGTDLRRSGSGKQECRALGALARPIQLTANQDGDASRRYKPRSGRDHR